MNEDTKIMRTTRHTVALTLILLNGLAAGGAAAQTMYKCGNTFSQMPCGDNATEIKNSGVKQPPRGMQPLPPDAPATEQTLQTAKTLCESAILGQLKDPDSARFDPPVRGSLRRVSATGQVLRDYTVYVNAKNSYGGYTGAKRWVCSMDASEQAVLWSGPGY